MWIQVPLPHSFGSAGTEGRRQKDLAGHGKAVGSHLRILKYLSTWEIQNTGRGSIATPGTTCLSGAELRRTVPTLVCDAWSVVFD